MDKVEMPAGRELDALVAEKVMLWVVDRLSNHWCGVPTNGTALPSDIPSYSTDIGAAWEVVEKMRTHSDVQVWVRFVWELPMSARGIHALLANLSPEAICRAALKASEG